MISTIPERIYATMDLEVLPLICFERRPSLQAAKSGGRTVAPMGDEVMTRLRQEDA